MELREVVKNLSVKSDVCLLNSEELIEKYCKDEKKYNEFIDAFSRVFSRRKIFPIMASFKYRDIENMINTGKEYSSPMLEEKEVDILREIYKNENQSYLDIRGDDYGQVVSLFNESIGAYKVKNDIRPCGEKMKKMKECAEIYLMSDRNISKEEYVDFTKRVYFSDELATYPHRLDKILNECYADNPKMTLCFNNDFLYLINYLIFSHPECCDEEIIKFAKNIISISVDARELIPYDFSKKEYFKLAKHTLQKIDKLEKEKNNLVNPKKKRLSFFNK